MKYEVWLGSIELYAVESVEESAERKITVYDAVGAGKFPQAENRGLKSWGIQCELTEHNDRGLSNWTEASEIFDGLEALLNKKSPARLVIRSDYGKASERVLLKSFSKEETVSGVYAVKIACTEYVSAAVRTTDVPYVARPGKLPEVPKVAKISYKDPGKSPFELMTQANRTADSPYGPLRGVRKRFSSSEDALKYIQSVTFLDPKTLQTRNPAALKDGDKVAVKPFQLVNDESGRAGYYDEDGTWNEESAFGLEAASKSAVSWFKKYVSAFDQTVEDIWDNPDWEGNKYMP